MPLLKNANIRRNVILKTLIDSTWLCDAATIEIQPHESLSDAESVTLAADCGDALRESFGWQSAPVVWHAKNGSEAPGPFADFVARIRGTADWGNAEIRQLDVPYRSAPEVTLGFRYAFLPPAGDCS